MKLYFHQRSLYPICFFIVFLIISSCHKRFTQIDPVAVKQNKNAKIDQRKILATLPELRVSTYKLFCLCNFVIIIMLLFI